MTILARLVVSLLVFAAVYLFSYWLLFVQVLPESMPWASSGAALATGFAAGWFVWSRLVVGAKGIVATVVVWAVVVGAIGFSVGFFGPMILAPDANQGPLLGLFITGPLGFVVGGIGGLIYALWRRTA
jgi:hypothetical protein